MHIHSMFFLIYKCSARILRMIRPLRRCPVMFVNMCVKVFACRLPILVSTKQQKKHTIVSSISSGVCGHRLPLAAGRCLRNGGVVGVRRVVRRSMYENTIR